ncbi:MAG TPA: hypothetical protein VMN39_10880 [Longimicrobiaceae bacterium]|nr:hypothetical protein [Longimicrobiaceae bacterium]
MRPIRMRVAIVVAAPEDGGGAMASRIPSFLHPVAGRPLLWHTLIAVTAIEDAPDRVLVLMPPDLTAALPEDVPPSVRALPLDPSDPRLAAELESLPPRVVLVRGSAHFDPRAFEALIRGDGYAWLGEGEDDMVAVATGPDEARAIAAAGDLSFSEQPPVGWQRIGDTHAGFSIRTRADLSRMQRLVRDRLVATLMDGGVTFLLPESVVVDVDVRIGRDTIVYPGAVLEGQTMIGEETVIGPGCRIIDSWIGSGVELKGWNYISHASVRNRAILEPYVRRGFD